MFEEQIIHETRKLNYYLNYGSESFFEARLYFPDVHDYNLGPEEYVVVAQGQEVVWDTVIGSLTYYSTRLGTVCEKKMEAAGADAVELNVYYIRLTQHVGC